MTYEELFQRNYGIFTEKEQETIRRSRILIIGCGGIGATVAIMLARSGLGNFVLVDFDVYSPSNMNRQICCFAETVGRKKAHILREDILRINPEATVTVFDTLLSHNEIEQVMEDCDFVFPAADDFAFSLFVFRSAQNQGKPSLLVVPSGTWANVSIIGAGSPPPENIEGVPKLSTYEGLREILEIRKYKFGTYFYVPMGDWRIDYYSDFIEKGIPPTQICPTVWISAALGAFEIVKYITKKWKPVVSPRYWSVTRNHIGINRINGLSLQTLLVWQRNIMWKLFQTPAAPYQEKLQTFWWNLYYPFMKTVERRRSGRRSAGATDPAYYELFGRNLGVFTREEQDRIRQTRIAVVGDSGTGEILATLLARCGFSDFIIAGQDVYTPSDMNRQAGCFTDTIGRNKISVIRDTLLAINPRIRITPYGKLPDEDEMKQLFADVDIVIPAVDDLAYSVLLFRAARRFDKTAVLCLPAGTAGWVSVFTEGTPSLETMLGIPSLAYDNLLKVLRTREYRCAQYNYVVDGDWRVDWFFQYFTAEKPLALICPVEWMAASLAALETIKTAMGRWAPMTAPRCWHIRKGKVSASRFSFTLRAHRKLGWLIFGSDQGLRRHRLTHFIWKHFFNYLRNRELSRSSDKGRFPKTADHPLNAHSRLE
ncbi:MAG TPA: hypothetical protein ENO00_00635 [Deltaproteobacteria bacterium]|nr:hypothetical protein [Deltaproteobacteria bacterium]